ncbi:pre-rRNA-processing protein ESF2 [Folsomia candida]|nr:pre-rRNA-processing protein ESF2 [Folsomia candida]
MEVNNVEIKEEKPEIEICSLEAEVGAPERNGLKKVKKESKPGIIYLSTVPPKMNVLQIREYFSAFGPINRSFMQPDKKIKHKGKGRPKNQIFTEGWIEFLKRRHAKKVASMLNNRAVGGKKRKEYHDHLWNIKYLPGFQWVHLNERLAYERISTKAKIRAEVSAAKREASYFAKNVELSGRLKKKGVLTKSGRSTEKTAIRTTQKLE